MVGFLSIWIDMLFQVFERCEYSDAISIGVSTPKSITRNSRHRWVTSFPVRLWKITSLFGRPFGFLMSSSMLLACEGVMLKVPLRTTPWKEIPLFSRSVVARARSMAEVKSELILATFLLSRTIENSEPLSNPTMDTCTVAPSRYPLAVTPSHKNVAGLAYVSNT